MSEEFHSINQLLAHRAKNSPDTVVLIVPDRSLKTKTFTFRDLDTAASLLADYYNRCGVLPVRQLGDNETRLVAGIFAQSDYNYVVNELALMRLGYCVLLISPNNSVEAVAHLLQETKASHVIVSDPYLQTLEEAVRAQPDQSNPVNIILQPEEHAYEADKTGPRKKVWSYPLPFHQESEMPFVIIHSSGSTGFPKPITITHRAGVINYSQNFGLKALTTLPLYHNHGHSNFYRSVFSCKALCLFTTAIIPLAASNLIPLLSNPDHRIEAFYGVPFALKILVEHPEGISTLKQLRLVMYGGSALSDELGDKLVENGVRLVGHYGLTETGQIGTSFRDFDADRMWNYTRVSGPLASSFLRFEEQESGQYELVVLDGWPAKVVNNAPDNSFRTKDLFLKHPSIPGAWKYSGRLDDTLVMVNGEKTNPVPMELTLKGESIWIKEAIVFGAGRLQTGALVVPSEAAHDKTHEEILGLIKPVIDIVNARAPSHSALSMECLIILPINADIPRADKGSFIRQKVYRKYEKEIEELYLKLSGDPPSHSPRKMEILSINDTLLIVRDIFKQTVALDAESLRDDTDIFDAGIDSIQAARVRNALQQTFVLKGKILPTNFVFENPSLIRIAEALSAIMSSTDRTLETAGEHTGRYMVKLVASYMQDLHEYDTLDGVTSKIIHHNPNQCVCLTGVTGSLGAHILGQYLKSSSTRQVWCLVRAEDNVDAFRRVEESMSLRGLSDVFRSSVAQVTCLASDLRSDDLGLSYSTLKEMLESVSLIVHSAWPVNFNMDLISFEPHIRSAVNLMKTALTCRPNPAYFYFASSISAVYKWRGIGDVPETVTNDPSFAQDMGYAQSKWIVEKLCGEVWKRTRLYSGILRIGQLVGDTAHGIWNETEAIPLIIKESFGSLTCSDTIGILPELNESLSWLPVDQAAEMIVDLTSRGYAAGTDCPCWHILQPNILPWTEFLDYLTSVGLEFERVTVNVWLRYLEQSIQDPIANPPIKLLQFYTQKYSGHEAKPASSVKYQITRTMHYSRVMTVLRPLTPELVLLWVQHWKRTSFLH